MGLRGRSNEVTRSTLLDRGRQVIDRQRFHAFRKSEHEKLRTSMSSYATTTKRIEYSDYQRVQQEIHAKHLAERKKRIGPFNFEYDDDIEAEVLHSDEVYKDLKELKNELDK